MNNEIKFLFFDMGNVLLKFDHRRLTKQVAALVGKTESDIDQLLFHPPHDLENRYERGEFTSQEFYERFCELAEAQVPQRDFMDAVADIFWLNAPILPLLSQLTAVNFPTAILSNTCEAHWEWVEQSFKVIRDFFPQRILSYEEESMKPDGKIYQAAIVMAKQQVGCQTEEIFFVDDKPENVAAAREAGMQAELFESTAMLASQLVEGSVPIAM